MMPMLQNYLQAARSGQTVYISVLHEAFAGLPEALRDTVVCVVELMDEEARRDCDFVVHLPRLDELAADELTLVRDYFNAAIYNILSSLGGRRMTLYVDGSRRELVAFVGALETTFCAGLSRQARSGYGRSINVIDRMLAAVAPAAPPFAFAVNDQDNLARRPQLPALARQRTDTTAFFRACTEGLDGQAIAGIDVGGTDIKAVLVVDGVIVEYKEYDWFPASFTRSAQLIEPIVLIARLLRARLAIHRCVDERRGAWLSAIEVAMERGASDERMAQVLRVLDESGVPAGDRLSAIGLCFPDVVVRNKIVGGEVYKTRGIRNNPDIDFEADFAQLTHLDDRLRACVEDGGCGGVHIINDGPMAAFTAAVEMAYSGESERIADGVFAHTLGTELGTGWITEAGTIPDIPLEVYNFIIDLGSWPERAYGSDDLRSVNNFNTGLPGTLQKYCSQSGIFRLALKYFPSQRPDLFAELKALGYVVERNVDGVVGYYVPTEPIDQRKAFLEHMMRLPERENDETNARIWREIGEALAVTLLESKRILAPGTDERFLFGRLVKNATCFSLMIEGARRIKSDAALVVAGTGMANTALMKQLEKHPQYTVAQFAQAIGAVYYANR